MRFLVKYSSRLTASAPVDKPPRPGMVPGRCDDWDNTCVWYPEGCNVVIPEDEWEDEIVTIKLPADKLWEFAETNGRIIVGRDYETKEPRIEIYNARRE